MAQSPRLESIHHVYIPADRRRALGSGALMPAHCEGAALFADISGFTPLTEALARTLGPRRGADELTRQLNRVYDALIAVVHRYGGSVLGFAGDAITCWFDETDHPYWSLSAALRAVLCALAMQEAMAQFKSIRLKGGETATLAMKVAVASGPALRFVVGDSKIQLLDALAGQTIQRMAWGEHQAERGDVVVDAATVMQLDKCLDIATWREDEEHNERFAVVSGVKANAMPDQLPLPPLEMQLTEQLARPWLLPAIYERVCAGLGEFLLELRPVVALFLNFEGIDYDHDREAVTKLDTYIRWVQQTVTRYEGTLLQLIIGDKGNYLYATFGAPLAHEDDVHRALGAALELVSPPESLDCITNIKIGISQGTMRTGAYGSSARRTYAAIGDDVNLAARLMQNAAPGSILVSPQVYENAAQDFVWKHWPPLRVKGKSEPIAVATPLRHQTAQRTIEYTGDFVGRELELHFLEQSLAPIFEGQFGGIVYIYGEAGVGKSRLLYELRQTLEQQHPTYTWDFCPTDPLLQQSLNPFKYFLRHYFEQNPEAAESTNKAHFEARLNALITALQRLDQQRLGQPNIQELMTELQRTRSVLGALVDLYWDKSLYAQLEPEMRFRNTLLAFRTLIQAESMRQPVILHLEDGHWLDADSQELLQTLTRNSTGYPYVILASGRYRDDGSGFTFNLDASLPQQTLDLNTLSSQGVQALAQQVLQGTVADDLADFLLDKTEGNPLFVEQLAMDLQERHLLLREDDGWHLNAQDIAAVPATINAVLIARIDRLAAQIKAVVQTAAVLGREFEVLILSQMLQEDRDLPNKVRRAEEEMIWSALNEMRYIFRHTMLRDAAYDMQLQARLQSLHALAAESVERVYAAELSPHYADLAFHYNKAQHREQEFRYAQLAGEYAVAQYANQEAITHFLQALQSAAYLNPQKTRAERRDIHATLGELLVTTGQYEAAQEHLDQALMLAQALYDREGQARVYRWLARMFELRSAYPQALMWVARGFRALAGRETVDAAELALIAGMIHSRQGDYEEAQSQGENALRIAQNLNELAALARTYNLLGHISRLRGQTKTAIDHFQRAFELHQQTENLHGQATLHNQIANVYFDLGEWREADLHYREARQMFDRIGDVYLCAVTDNNLGEIALYQGRLDEARTFYQQALTAMQQLGSGTYVLGVLHMNLGHVFIRRGEIAVAREHLNHGQDYFEQAEVRDFLPEMHRHFAEAALYAEELDEATAQANQALSLARELEMRGEQGYALWVLGQIAVTQTQYTQAQNLLEQSLSILQEMGDEYGGARCYLSLAELYGVQEDRAQLTQAMTECTPVFEKLGAMLDLNMLTDLKERFEI